jgi:urea transport system substrate-binding protein
VKAAALLLAASLAVVPLSGCGNSGASSASVIKVGILHSLTGTMSISEPSLKDAEMMAIDEINAKGGVLGKKIEPVVADGASDWPTFKDQAQRLFAAGQSCDRLWLLDLGQ